MSSVINSAAASTSKSVRAANIAFTVAVELLMGCPWLTIRPVLPG